MAGKLHSISIIYMYISMVIIIENRDVSTKKLIINEVMNNMEFKWRLINPNAYDFEESETAE